MGVDSLSSIAPARVRCLLLPFGRITRSNFFDFANRLQNVSIVRLGDISPNKAPESGMFSPLAFPDGAVVYHFADSHPAPSHRSLLPFEMCRETLVVLAISDGKKYAVSSAQQSDEQGPHAAVGEFAECVMSLQDNYPTALVHRLVLFDFDTEGARLPTDTMTIPSVDHGPATALKTVMADITSTLLSELGPLARSIQGLPTVDTPKAVAASSTAAEDSRRASRPSSRLSPAPGSGKSSPAPDTARLQQRASMPPQLVAPDLAPSNANRPLSGISNASRPLSGTSTPTSTFDDMSGVGNRSSIGAAEASVHSSDRISTQGFGSGTAGERVRNQGQNRLGVITGSLYLLAGRWPDAVKALSEGANVAKVNSDYAWHAKALDLLLVALLMQAWAKVEFEVPSVCYPFGDRSLANRNKRSRSVTANGEKGESESGSTEMAVLKDLSPIIFDLANNILHLYTRAAEFNSCRVPQVLFSETTIRLSRLMCAVRSSGGTLTHATLQSLVVGPSKSSATSASKDEAVPYPPRSDVASFVHRAMPQPSDEFLETSDRLRILAGVASVLSDLGFQRKKGLVLRELVLALLPALVQSRKDSAAELGLHPAASLSSLETAPSGSHAMLGQVTGMGGGMTNFLALICDIYGVVNPDYDTPRPGTSTSDDYEDVDAICKRALTNALRRKYGHPLLKIDILRSCINICEALPDLSGLLRFSSSLLSTAGSGLAPGPSTIDSSLTLPLEDQLRLSTNISRAVNAAKQLGQDDAEAEYWDEFLVRDIVLMANGSGSNIPVARRKADLDQAKTATAKEAKEGPFIFNPFASKPTTAVKETLLVVSEEAVFTLLLQNLCDMDMEIEWIKFDTDDMAIDVAAKNIIIGPYRTQNVQLLCTPRKAGQLKLSGCIAKVKGCRARRFPLFRSPWRMQDPLKLKQHGLAAAATEKEDAAPDTSEEPKPTKPQPSELPEPSSFDALVIAAQPTVVLQSTSLSQSALMLLDGETCTFSVTLKNASDTAIDLFLVSLADSTADQLQAAVANKDLSPAELYEAELSAKERPALRLRSHAKGEELSIDPHGELVLEIEVFGKLGLTRGTINIEYCHLGVPRSEVQDRFFTRQLAVPFEVTVNSSLGLLYNDVLPMPSDALHLAKTGSPASGTDSLEVDAAQHFRKMLQGIGDANYHSEHCLLMLDFNNAWSEPISLTLNFQPPSSTDKSSDTKEAEPYVLKTLIQPLRTTRLLLPFPKLLLDDPHAPVPSLDPRHKRQFVVSTSDGTRPDMERLARELFWYREEALKHLHATWAISSQRISPGSDPSLRHGVVDLRRLSVVPRMLEALRQDDLVITLSMAAGDAEPHDAVSPTTLKTPSSTIRPSAPFRIHAGTFVTLAATLRSRVPHTVQPLLRLQPALRHQPYHVALDLGRKVAVNGVLQRALPRLSAGATHTARVGLAFLAPGEYEVAALVEEVRILSELEEESAKDGGRRRSATADFGLGDVGKRTERRTWYARQACLVDVVAAEDEKNG